MSRCISGGMERIAVGWNQHASAVRFSAIEGPWFSGYKEGGYVAEWQGQDELVLASDRQTRIKVGLPTMRLTFPILYAEEIQILREMEGQVSIYALDQDTFLWKRFNAVLFMPDAPGPESKYEKRDFTITFQDLVELS